MASGYQTINMEHFHHYRKFFWATLLPEESLFILQTKNGTEECKVPLPLPCLSGPSSPRLTPP